MKQIFFLDLPDYPLPPEIDERYLVTPAFDITAGIMHSIFIVMHIFDRYFPQSVGRTEVWPNSTYTSGIAHSMGLSFPTISLRAAIS
jgi:hypothetical protein